jgi:hypothetical protein
MDIDGRKFPSSCRFITVPFPPRPSPYYFEDPPRPTSGPTYELSLFGQRQGFFDAWARNLVTTVVATYSNVELLLAPHNSSLPTYSWFPERSWLSHRVDVCLAALTPDEKRFLGVLGSQFNNNADPLTCSPIIKMMWGHLVSAREKHVLTEMLRLCLKLLKPHHRTEDVLVEYFEIDQPDIVALDQDNQRWNALVRSFFFDFDNIMVSRLDSLFNEMKPLTSREATLQAVG